MFKDNDDRICIVCGKKFYPFYRNVSLEHKCWECSMKEETEKEVIII